MARKKNTRQYLFVPGFLRCKECGWASLCVVKEKTGEVTEVPSGWVQSPDGTWLCDDCARKRKG